MKRAEFLDVVGYLVHHFCEFGAFGCRNPRKLNPVFVKTHKVEQLLRNQEATAGKVITADIVAIAGMAAGYKDAIRRRLQRFDEEPWVNPRRTWHTDDADVWRILNPGSSC